MTRPLVSVLVATYNQERHIEETVDSILAQDWRPLQVIVADDASTDGTAALLNRLAALHKELHLVAGGTNVGIGANTNRGWAACQGEYCALLGGDDLMLPGKLTAQVDWFSADDQRALCGHAVEHFDSDTGAAIRVEDVAPTGRKGGAGPTAFIEQWNVFPGVSLMFRSAFAPRSGFDARLKWTAERKFTIELLMGGGAFGAIPGVLTRYRRHPRQTTQTFQDALWAEAFMTQAIIEAEYPQYARAARHGRSFQWKRHGISALAGGSPDTARRSLRRALRESLSGDPKLWAWTAVAHLPTPVRDAAVTFLLKRASAEDK